MNTIEERYERALMNIITICDMADIRYVLRNVAHLAETALGPLKNARDKPTRADIEQVRERFDQRLMVNFPEDTALMFRYIDKLEQELYGEEEDDGIAELARLSDAIQNPEPDQPTGTTVSGHGVVRTDEPLYPGMIVHWPPLQSEPCSGCLESRACDWKEDAT